MQELKKVVKTFMLYFGTFMVSLVFVIAGIFFVMFLTNDMPTGYSILGLIILAGALYSLANAIPDSK